MEKNGKRTIGFSRRDVKKINPFTEYGVSDATDK